MAIIFTETIRHYEGYVTWLNTLLRCYIGHWLLNIINIGYILTLMTHYVYIHYTLSYIHTYTATPLLVGYWFIAGHYAIGGLLRPPQALILPLRHYCLRHWPHIGCHWLVGHHYRRVAVTHTRVAIVAIGHYGAPLALSHWLVGLHGH